jgi:putative heme iron utilization protein
MERRSSRADAVRALLRAQKAGVLCTLSAKLGGAPFGSLASYAVSGRGEPIFFFSALAQHTQNLVADPRCSLFVYDAVAAADDPQQGQRACLVGRAFQLAAAEGEDAKERFLAVHPQAVQWLELDFQFFRLAVEEVQYVGGFAQAGWVPAAEVLD